MPGKIASFRSIRAQGIFHVVAGFWFSVLLSICHITDVSAMIPATPDAILSAKTENGARYSPVRYCEEGYECGEHERATEYHEPEIREEDSHYDKGWYTRPERRDRYVETECEGDYEIVEVLPVPEPYDYDPYRGYGCGVRCWYKRLTSGYCGRGCEYYLYRTGRSRHGCRSGH
jgi:hypothetical protein